MKHTKIEWTERVWNPSIGCDKVSAGCKNCYAEIFAKRLQAIGMKDYTAGFAFKVLPHRLAMPLTIKKPTRFFVNSMSDLFHEHMPFEFLDEVFDVVSKTPQHTYQILTKRAEKMREYFHVRPVPANVWLGVSIESATYKYRADLLKQIDALIRFISFEPLIGSIGQIDLSGIHWAIVGGESGKKARQIKIEWVDEIFDQCKQNEVAFFFKQWGTWGPDLIKRSKKANGRVYQGIVWDYYPAAA